MNSELFYLLRAYGALFPVSETNWPTSTSSFHVHEFLVDHLLLNEHFRLFPPSSPYQRTFWKWVIHKLEECGEEVDERIYGRYLAVMPKSSKNPKPFAQPPGPSYTTHWWSSFPSYGTDLIDLAKYHSTTLLESRTTIESGTTGLRTWTASFVLAQHFIRQPGMVAKKRILELGSGTGFLGMVIARLQLDAETLSAPNDGPGQPYHLEAHPELVTRLVDWLAAIDEARLESFMSTLREADPQLIVGADIVYDPSIIPPLVATLRALLGLVVTSEGSRRDAYIALTVRNDVTIYEFVRQARAVLYVQEEPLDSEMRSTFLGGAEGGPLAESESLNIKIFHITSKYA